MSDLGQDLEKALGSTYRILRELGGGGMSRVFLAEEVGLQRQVVVKVLPPEMAAGVHRDIKPDNVLISGEHALPIDD